jgi:hypothetical protein
MMSRLWDTPEFWASSEADELLHDFPNTTPTALAASLTRSSPHYEGDPDFARDIVRELLKRAAAGVRFWPEPAGLEILHQEVKALIWAGEGNPSSSDPDDDHLEYWWQRM